MNVFPNISQFIAFSFYLLSLSPHIKTVFVVVLFCFFETPDRQYTPEVGSSLVWHRTTVCQLHTPMSEPQCIRFFCSRLQQMHKTFDCRSEKYEWTNKRKSKFYLLSVFISFHILITNTSLFSGVNLLRHPQSTKCSYLLPSRALWHVHSVEQESGPALWPGR